MNNWKTTLAGFIGGVMILYSQGLNFKGAVLAGALQAIGLLAKDRDVTGGTRKTQ